MAANTRFVVKRSATSGKTPNTADPANSSYIAAGELALNMTDKLLYTSDGSSRLMFGNKRVSESPNVTNQSNSTYIGAGDFAIDYTNKKVYSSTGSEAFEIGSSVTTVVATTVTSGTVNFSDSASSGDLATNLMTLNSTSIFVGNNTTNSTVNNSILRIIDPDHSVVLAADTIKVTNTSSNIAITPASIAVSNTQSNSQLTPSVIFVGNSTSNAQFNLTKVDNSYTVTSYTFNASDNIATFQLNTNHNFTLPLRGTQVLIQNMTGGLAALFNNQSHEVYSTPTSSSFTIRKNALPNKVNSAAGSIKRYTKTISSITDVLTSGVKLPSIDAGVVSISLYGVVTLFVNSGLRYLITEGTPIYISEDIGGLNAAQIYYVTGSRVDDPYDVNKCNVTLSSTLGGDPVSTTTWNFSVTPSSAIAHYNATLIPVGTTAIFSGTTAGTLLTDYSYYITAVNLSTITTLTLSLSPGGSPISITSGTGASLSAAISGITQITTATQHYVTTGTTVSFNGLGASPVGLSFDGTYSILKANNTTLIYSNNPSVSYTPTGMYIDNGRSNWSNKNPPLKSTVRKLRNDIATGAVFTAEAIALGKTSAYPPIKAGATTGSAALVNDQVVFYGTYNGSALSGTTFGGIVIDRPYYVKSTAYSEAIGSWYYVLSEKLGGDPVSWTTSDDVPAGYTIYATTRWTTVNYIKENHGIPDGATIDATINATSNSVISHICFPYTPGTTTTEAGLLTAHKASSIDAFALTANSIYNQYNTGLARLKYATQDKTLGSSKPVRISVGTYGSKYPSTVDTKLPVTSTSYVISMDSSDTAGLTSGWVTIPADSFTDVTTTVANPFTIVGVRTSGSLQVLSTTTATVGMVSGATIQMPSSTLIGSYGLTGDAQYTLSAAAGTTTTKLQAVTKVAKAGTSSSPTYTITAVDSGLAVLTIATSASSTTVTGNNTVGHWQTSNSSSDGSISISSSTYSNAPAIGQQIQFITATTGADIGNYTVTDSIKPPTGYVAVATGFVGNKTYVITNKTTVGTNIKLTLADAAAPSTPLTTTAVNPLFANFVIVAPATTISTYTSNFSQFNNTTQYLYSNTSSIGKFMYCLATGAASYSGNSVQNVGTVKFLGNTTLNTSGVITKHSDNVVQLKGYNPTTIGTSVLGQINPIGINGYYASTIEGSSGRILRKQTFDVTNTAINGILTCAGNSQPFYVNSMIAFTGTSFGGLVANTAYYITAVDNTDPTKPKITIANTRSGSATTSTSACNTPSAYMSGHGHFSIGDETYRLNPSYEVGDYLLVTDTNNQMFNTAVSGIKYGFCIVVNKATNVLCLSPISPNADNDSFSGLTYYTKGTNFYVNNLINITTGLTTLPIFNKFIPVTQDNSKLSYTYYNKYVGAVVRVWDANTFSVDSTTLDTTPGSSTINGNKFNWGYFGTKDNPIPLTNMTIDGVSINRISKKTDSATNIATVAGASLGVTTVYATGTSFTAQSNFSSYVEIANSASAIKMTPTTFYIGNSAANVYSNSSFFSINQTDQILEIGPGSLFIAKALNGVPNTTTGYLYANSTNIYAGNATKFTVIDSTGNIIQKGSTLTISDDISTTQLDDYSFSIFDGSACTSITTTEAIFPGAVTIGGALTVQGTTGVSGQVLLTDGQSAYWGDTPPLPTNIEYNFEKSVSVSGDFTTGGNVLHTGGSILYKDNVLNYTVSTPTTIDIVANSSAYLQLSTGLIGLYSEDTYSNSVIIDARSITIGNSSIASTLNSTAFSGTSLNASYLGNVPAERYVSTTDNYTIAGNLYFTSTNSVFNSRLTVGNSTVNTVINSTSFTGTIYASGGTGAVGQVLRSNGSGTAYWDDGSQATNARQVYTADGSTSTFTVTAGYTPNNLDVYLNGVKLQNGTEVTVSSGTTFTITSTPPNGAVIEVVGGVVAGIATATPFVTATATSVTINPSLYNGYFYTALASTLTINASTTGSPVNGTKMIFRFKDNGTARTLTWTISGSGCFRTFGTSLPGVTIVGKTTYVACIYNAEDLRWDVLAVAVQD